MTLENAIELLEAQTHRGYITHMGLYTCSLTIGGYDMQEWGYTQSNADLALAYILFHSNHYRPLMEEMYERWINKKQVA